MSAINYYIRHTLRARDRLTDAVKRNDDVVFWTIYKQFFPSEIPDVAKTPFALAVQEAMQQNNGAIVVEKLEAIEAEMKMFRQLHGWYVEGINHVSFENLSDATWRLNIAVEGALPFIGSKPCEAADGNKTGETHEIPVREAATNRRLNPTAQMAFDFIRDNPGKQGREIADHIHKTYEYFRTGIVPALKEHGVTSDRGRGYYPPGT